MWDYVGFLGIVEISRSIGIHIDISKASLAICHCPQLRQELLLGSEEHISATSDVFTHEAGAQEDMFCDIM